jgi:ankyrin repeat protein
MLADDPSLVRARSMRDHRSTLLHYVSANGIEDFRQKTPGNICEMAQLLLEAGADVNAESDAYGGGSTTLLLVATSVHPDRAGLQLAILNLLLDHGATVERPGGSGAVNTCLHNGRARAAEFLASRGARLDLEDAAGVGQLDVVQSFFLADGSLRPPATMQQLVNGFCWACQFGHSSTVRFLLRHGVRAEAAINAQHQTGLHHAALGGNVDIVRTLLQHGADVNARETAFGGTPLGWALHGWANAVTSDDAPRYCEAVAVLVQAGASTAEFTMPKDSRMQAALRGEYRVI